MPWAGTTPVAVGVGLFTFGFFFAAPLSCASEPSSSLFYCKVDGSHFPASESTFLVGILQDHSNLIQ